MDVEQVVTALELVLGAALPEEAFDVLQGMDDEPDAVDVVTDDWTLHLERWPDGLAFIALEEEPDEPTGDAADAALRRVLGPALGALATVDDVSGGRLAERLSASGDPLSARLAELLRGEE